MLTAHPQIYPQGGLLSRLDHWTDTHSNIVFALVRMVLGLILLQKGLYFISNMGETQQSLRLPTTQFDMFWLAHYIVFAHLIGGLMLVLGLWTRLAAIVQLPILLGAVLLTPYAPDSYIAQGTSQATAIITLILLVAYIILGSGHFSMDHYLATHAEDEDEPYFDTNY